MEEVRKDKENYIIMSFTPRANLHILTTIKLTRGRLMGDGNRRNETVCIISV